MGTSSEVQEDDTVGLKVEQRERVITGPASAADGSLDRYVVLEQVGSGGMGVVHRAYDPKLRREVALKMLRFDRREGSGAIRAETRILREARAMAQLSHPHVLPVYDVEHVGGLVYIAMEYVDGQTLSRWMRRQTRPWAEVVEVFAQAGQGLAAAHQAGIIHRDFKPSNVLMGNRGRVLVTDFGLARAHDDREEDDMADAWSSGEHGNGETITESGEVVGTPAYMAPEQLRGEPVDARADQYAFCIALYEGLFGRRPFAVKDHRSLLVAKQAARIEPDPAITVPTWLFRIVERGLAPAPGDRFASMNELLGALGHDPAQARRRWMWGASGAITTATLIGLSLATTDSEPMCTTADALAQSLWSDAQGEQVRAALLATGQGYAAETATRVATQLDRYADQWSAAHLDACEATHVRHNQSGEAFDLRMACLRRQEAELETTVETLSGHVDADTLSRAAGLVAALPNPDRCADVEALRSRGRAVDPRNAAAVELQRERLARANAMVRAWRTQDAQALTGEIEQRVGELGDPVLRGETKLLRGELALQIHDAPSAETWYREAFAEAVQGRDATLAIDASLQLINTVGVRQARTAEGELWAEQARSWLRGRNPTDPRIASLLIAEGGLYQAAGQLDEAKAAFSSAVDKLEGNTGSTDLAHAHRTLGLSLMALGEIDEAQIQFSRLLALREKLLGPHHPDVGQAHQNLGGSLYAAGQLTNTLPHYEKALMIFETALGPDHPRLVSALGNLGALRDDLGEPDDAREHFERALRIAEAGPGTPPGEMVGLLRNLAAALEHAGEPEDSVRRLEQAAGLLNEAYGPDHPEGVDLLAAMGAVLAAAGEGKRAREILEQADARRTRLPVEAGDVSANVARTLGRVLGEQGEHARAETLLTEATRLYREQGTAFDPLRGNAMLELGEVQLAMAKPVEARITLEAAIPLLTTPQVEATRLARARFGLARALARGDVGDEGQARALRLAEDALVGLDDDDPMRREVQAWLVRHTPR